MDTMPDRHVIKTDPFRARALLPGALIVRLVGAPPPVQEHAAASSRTAAGRRALFAAAGPTSAVLLLVATLVAVPGTDRLEDTASANTVILDIVAAHRDRTTVAGLCVVFGLLTMIGFVAGVAGLVTARGARFATWGAVIAGGGLGGAAIGDTFWFNYVRATDPALAPRRDVLAQFLATGTWALAVIALLAVVCMPVGIFLLAVGLFRSKIVAWWLPTLLIIALATFLALPDHLGGIGAATLLIVTALLFAPIAGLGPWTDHYPDHRPATPTEPPVMHTEPG